MSYEKQRAWKDLMHLLPEEYQFNDHYKPAEEWWEYDGHKVHLDCFRNDSADAKVILLHGVGTNGRQLSLICGGPLYMAGYETVAIDMPTYGITEVAPNKVVTYDDWVDLAVKYVEIEAKKDKRPIFLYGLSAGGMEAYHVACKSPYVKGIIGMTFLDQRIQQVRDETAKSLFWSRVGIPMAGISRKIGLGKFKMKMSIPSKMYALCNDEKAMDIFNKDKTSAANKVTMTFLDSYGAYVPAVEPEHFNKCPILLTQPDLDRWTPMHLSKLVLDKIKHAYVDIVTLPNGSHYPVEPEAIKTMNEAIINFIEKHK